MITTLMIVAYFLSYLAFPVLLVRALLRRNGTPVADRAHGVVYLTLAVAGGMVWWAAVSVVINIIFQFMPGSGSNLFASIGPQIYDPWNISFSGWEVTTPYAISPGFTELRFSPVNVTWWSKALYTAGTALILVVPVALALSVASVCARIIDGRPFGARLSALAWWTAGVVLVAGLGGQVLLNAGTYHAAVQVLPWLSAQTTGELPQITMAGVDLWPLYAALGVAVVAVLLKHGTRMQRDTDGLV